ncbi:MAG: hypothetical protein IT454_05880 [Planctomycetes bacterium]|nr:hypothetical protein [Planctomycetota bacterium]
MAAKETITVYDQQGQPREIPRAEFMEKALPKLLESVWNNADQLYQQVVFALNEGMHAGVLEAAKRLDELDQGAERGRVILSATQFQNGQLDAAEATLRGHIEKNGESSVTVVNLARIRQGRGDQEGAQNLLSRALELDPNQENALQWSCQLLHQEGGDEAVVEFLGELIQEPGRWRAQMWLAQHKLRTQDIDGGIALLRACAADLARDPNALLAVSADLGKAGKLVEMLEIVLPQYQERRQRPETGFNLLQALVQTGRIDEAKILHARIAALNLPPLAQALNHFASKLGVPQIPLPQAPAGAAGQAQPAAPQGQNQQIEIRLFVVQGPLWMQGLGAPWLAPEKDAKAPLVTFVGFADESLANVKDKSKPPRVDEELGRLARALPMYLCESVYLRTAARADMVVPLLPGGAFVVTGHTWPADALQKGRPDDQKPEYIVQGVLARDDGGHRVELLIFDAKTSQEVHRIRAIGLRKLSAAAQRLEDDLLDWLEQRGVARTVPKSGLIGKLFGGKPRSGPETVVRPAPDRQEQYLLALANLLGQAIPAIQLGSREILADEKGMLESCLEAAKGDPKCGAARAVAACSVLFALRYGSTQLEGAKAELLKLVDGDQDPQGVLRMLSPGIYARLGEKDKFERARKELEVGAGDAYKQWLGNLKS